MAAKQNRQEAIPAATQNGVTIESRLGSLDDPALSAPVQQLTTAELYELRQQLSATMNTTADDNIYVEAFLNWLAAGTELRARGEL